MATGTYPAYRLRQAGVSAPRITAIEGTYNGWSASQQHQFRAWIASNPDETIRRTYDPDGPGYTPADTGSADVTWLTARPEDHGAVGDGTTNDTAAVQAAMQAASDAGGGTVYLTPGRTYRCDGQLIKPVGYIRIISGAGPRYDFNIVGNQDPPTGGGILDLRHSGPAAKFLALTRGVIELDRITLTDNGTSSTPFLLVTYPQPRIRGCYFQGNPTKTGDTCDQDAIVLGGTDTIANDHALTAAFGGYGGVIEGNVGTRIRRLVLARNYVNGIPIRGNTTDPTCGSNLPVDAPIVLDSGGTEANLDHHVQGNVIAENTLELMAGYSHGVILRNNARKNVVRDNGFWDPTIPGKYVAEVLCDEATGAIQNTLDFSGYSNPQAVPVSGLTAGDNTVTGAQSGRGGGVVYDLRSRSAGNIPVETQTWLDLPMTADPSVPAAPGDLLEINLSAFAGSEPNWLYLDVVTVVAGAAVNYVSRQLPLGPPESSSGVPGWVCPPNGGSFQPISGSVFYTVQAGDLAAGRVAVRLVGRLENATPARTFYGGGGLNPQLSVRNLG
jgi:hypothetical protein